ncbi:MAG: hypothetical protein IKX23_03735 [Treponema sp.]|nr:hypothetical protein [Treponema sp.]
MNILISNDDGIDAPGLKIIAERLKKDGHNILVIAPDSNRSAVSNHISMFKNNTLIKKDVNSYSHSGYPADCIFTGVTSGIFDKIDVIIAGINSGGNMGTDIIYSGTCAVAREGANSNIPSIALSAEPLVPRQSVENYKFDAIAEFAAENLEKLIAICKSSEEKAFVNVNALAVESHKGVKYTGKLCRRNYKDRIELVNTKDDLYEARFIGNAPDLSKIEEGTDLYYCRNGYIAVSLVKVMPDCIQIDDSLKF